MAVDEVLLASCAKGGGAALRFYRWSQPTLSLGYFQRHADRALHPASSGCPLVRRQTGGGAIVHDRELTYSLAVPEGHPLAQGSARLYEAVHGALIRSLAEMGIEARQWTKPSDREAARQPFLCFARRGPGDVLVGTTKVCGSAQRRQRGAILQHGSVLLERSGAAPELAGLSDVCGKRVPASQLVETWQETIAEALGLECRQFPILETEMAAARSLAAERYENPLWNQRR
jgi:lipoate-protein ligase A